MAGLFGGSTRIGPGVNKNEPEKKRLFLFFELFFTKFWKLMWLNLIYFAFCIPIVTIGPATTGFVYVLRNLTERKPTFVFFDFLEAFKKSWKQSVVLSLLNAAAVIVLSVGLDFYFARLSEGPVYWIGMSVCAGMTLVAVMMNYYTYLMLATLKLPFKQMMKNAFLLSVVGVGTNLITTLFVLLVAGFYWIWTVIALLLTPFLLPVLLGLIICLNSYRKITQYIIDPYYAEHPDEPEEEQAIFTDMGRQDAPEAEPPTPDKGKVIR